MRGNVRAQPSVAFRCDFFADFLHPSFVVFHVVIPHLPQHSGCFFFMRSSCTLLTLRQSGCCWRGSTLLHSSPFERKKGPPQSETTSPFDVRLFFCCDPLKYPSSYGTEKPSIKTKNKNKICSILFTSFPIYCFFYNAVKSKRGLSFSSVKVKWEREKPDSGKNAGDGGSSKVFKKEKK